MYYGYESRAKFIGTMSAIGFSLFLFIFCSFMTISPTVKPRDTEILIDMEPEELPKLEPQKSEAQTVAKRPNLSQESTVGDKGDVEVPEPPREKEINKRALFSSAQNTDKDTLAQQVAEKISEKLTAGHSQGNTKVGNPESEPSAKLEGRSVVGSLPLPVFESGDGGKIVVKILVNQEGKVISAVPGAPGTTISDKTLRESARKAALGALFNVSRTAPEAQEGTITYIFRVR